MARPLRIEFAGAWYHVMNRGIGRGAIFLNDGDRLYFLRLLAIVYRRYGLEVHAYCLMGNHYHLLVRTPEAQLARALRHVNGAYAQHFNRTHGRDGPLFRGRYKAVLVEAEVYWTHLSRYIHCNPLEAGLVDEPSDFPWSSYRYYSSGRLKQPEWLITNVVLSAFESRRDYRQFVESDNAHSPLGPDYGLNTKSSILGGDSFRANVMQDVEPHTEIPETRTIKNRPSIDTILRSVAAYYQQSPDQLRRSTRGRGVRSPARAMAMLLCQDHGGLRLHEIAAEFRLSSYASAGATICNLRRRLQATPSLREDLKLILQDLTP